MSLSPLARKKYLNSKLMVFEFRLLLKTVSMHNSDSKSSIVWVYHRHKKSYNFFGMNLKATTETSNSFDLMSSFVGA